MTNILTVSELNNDLKQTLTKSHKLVTVVGEITNYKNSTFFTLKDPTSQISCADFNKVAINLTNGKQVKITGSITVFPKDGKCSIIVKSIEMIGVGNLHKDYEDLKEKYAQLGYFDDKYKKQLKNAINKIAIITSQDGAALQDFIYALNKNGYIGTLHIKHSVVQGKDCPTSITNSLLELDELGFDVIVVSRGGGSFEDLFGFSDPMIIETIFKMKTFVVSAIGHQIDYMLSDFVADYRAPTPSLAAEYLSHRQNSIECINEYIVMENNIKDKITNILKLYDNEIKIIIHNLKPNDAIMDNILFDVGKLCNILNNNINNKLMSLYTEIGNIKISPQEKHVIIDKNKNIIDNIDKFKNIKNKDEITIKFANGYVTFNVNSIKICK